MILKFAIVSGIFACFVICGCIGSNVSAPSVAGKWTFYYDWGCTGSPGNGQITFNSDGSLILSVYGKNNMGKWTQNGNNIHWSLNNEPAVYDGTIQINTMSGNMSDNGTTGCWSANKY